MQFVVLLNLRRLRVTQSARTSEEGLGRTKVEVHVEANGKVVLVISDVEGDNIALLAVLFLYEGEDKATILSARIFHFKRLLATIDDALPLTVFAVSHEEVDAMSHLHFLS